MHRSCLRSAFLGCMLPLAASSRAQQLPAPHVVGDLAVQHTGGLGRLFDAGIEKVASSLDGRTFAMSDGSVWSVAAGGVIGEFGKPLRIFYLSAHGGWLTFADGNTVKLWTLASGEIRDFAQFDEPVEHLGGSPDETMLVAVTRHGGPELFQVASGSRIRNLRWSSEGQHLLKRDASVAFSPDGKLLACGSETWTVATGTSLLRTDGDFNAFTQDGRSLFSVVGNRSVEEWDLALGQKSSTFDLPATSSGRFSIAPDGRFGVLSEPLNPTLLTLWDMHAGLQTGVIRMPAATGGYSVFFLGSSDWLLVGTRHIVPRLVRISGRDVIATLDSDGRNWSVVRASDGAYDASPAALIADPGRNAAMSVDGTHIDQGKFTRVAGLLRTLPGAPGAPPIAGKPGRGHR